MKTIAQQVQAFGNVSANGETYYFAATEAEALKMWVEDCKQLAEDDEWDAGWETGRTVHLISNSSQSERLDNLANQICEYNPHHQNSLQYEYEAVRACLDNEVTVWMVE